MIIPHLLFAHLLADYPLQTNWIAARKSQALDGLLLHGLTVLIISALALSRYLDQLILPLLVLFAVHTTQDWLKVQIGRRLHVHLSIPYFADQGCHLLAIIVFQKVAGPTLEPGPGAAEQFAMSLGAGLIAVTRFYDVSWWANWFDMIVYMQRWQIGAALERTGMLLAATTGPEGAVAAPILAVPRLWWAWHKHAPLWTQKYGVLEWAFGIAFSLLIGLLALHPQLGAL